MNFFESLDQFLITSDCLSSQKSYWHCTGGVHLFFRLLFPEDSEAVKKG